MRTKRLSVFCVLLAVLWTGTNWVRKPVSQRLSAKVTIIKAPESLRVNRLTEKVIEDPFESFSSLKQKVLYTQAEKEELQRVLSDTGLIRRAYLDLANVNTAQEIRFERLDYLEKAIAWHENPSRSEVIDSVRNLILRDNLSEIRDIQARKSYAGDKIEALAMLKQHTPEELEVFEHLPKEGRIARLLAYANNLIESSGGFR